MIHADKISPLFWIRLNLKLFLVNDRGSQMPNLWGLCKANLQPVRRQLWNEILTLMDNNPGSWCCMGDFNVVLGANECRGSTLPSRLPCDEFKSFSENADLTHILTRGAEFTWTNKRRGVAHTEKRLDRSICNDHWLSMWTHTSCCTLPRSCSDHHPLLLYCSTNSASRMEELAQQELLGALSMEEAFWMEKSRFKWHTSGDRNTSFFHKVTKVRQTTKSMSLLKHGDNILTEPQDIASHVLSYYSGMYACPNNITPNNLIQSVVPNLVSMGDNIMLTLAPTSEEIRAAVFTMNGDGAPGPDGFGGCFYQNFWEIVASDVYKSVSQFFLRDWLLPNLNSNSVVLIPKSPSVDRIEDFRPIALANFQFKVITKVLAERLVVIAPKIISTNQRGFIKQRHIQDCLCIASKAVNLLDHKVFGGNLAIKLDIKKAFDTWDWKFLLDIYQPLALATSVRQGDPLSPLLFCIVEYVLSRGISNLLSEGKTSTISGPRRLQTTSHVLYVDDILIFCKGIKRELMALTELIKNYAHASGKVINQDKCKFYTSTNSARKILNLTAWLGFSAGCLPVSYLGVPLFKGKPRRIHLQPIADRIVNKLTKWKGSFLSIMGRVELVKTIIHSMMLYSFQVYTWPAQLLKHMDNCIRNFIWSGDIKVCKLVTMAWHEVCMPTIEGGLGLRSLAAINKAALLKLSWDMLSSPQDWSYQLLEGQLARNPLVDSLEIPASIHDSLSAIVADFIIHSKWIIPTWMSVFHPQILDYIAKINISDSSMHDRLIWKNTGDGLLTMKAAFECFCPPTTRPQWCKTVWSNCIPPSKSFTFWRLHKNRMPTDENLQRRGMSVVSICTMCLASQETSDHLFLKCHFAVTLWNWLSCSLNTYIDTNSTASILQVCFKSWSPQVKEVVVAAIINIVSAIWYCRNKARFDDAKTTTSKAISRIIRETSLFGNTSKLYSNPSLQKLVFLKMLKVDINHYKALAIVEVIWLSPSLGWTKINTDGAAHGSPGHAGGGGIFRDNEGAIQSCFATYYGVHDSLYAELLSAIIAIEIAVFKGWKDIWLQCDSAIVVDIFNGKFKPPWKLIQK
ncbi:PREDICTED: uncharacterized protein LOC109359677 [Lupinus angustifolius]|uniref:uncharacterized protein LOC109359677 n=1 Tax=Lupinus angustifolius TaxID=3871 RepID=UPI00092E9057|nr:PREDICTED: uncharacterized protein LOC109359677 [Lupinus angustifolius]